jgi:hypothetical protein
MTPEQIEQFLNDIATKAQPAAQHVFDLAVRQVVIDGLFQMLQVVVILAFVAILTKASHARVMLYCEQVNRDDSDIAFAKFVCNIIYVVVWVVALILAVAAARDALNNLLNPEWQVVLKLAGLLTGSNK